MTDTPDAAADAAPGITFCQVCARIMERRTNPAAELVFVCPTCTFTQHASESSYRICGVQNTEISLAQKYRTLILSAMKDPITEKVMAKCPKCPMNYLSQVCLPSTNTIVQGCSCGYNSAGLS